MNSLIFWDQKVFLWLNHLPHNQFLNLTALGLSGIGMLGIIWFLLGIILFIREEKKHQPASATPKALLAGHWFFAPIILAGGLSWVLVEKVIKVLVGRARPAAEMGAVIVGSGNGQHDFSFPSGHATIAFSMAVVLSKIEPKWKWLFYPLALAISFTRIYLGKHFALDVIAGALIGWSIGQFSWWLAKYVNRRLKIIP